MGRVSRALDSTVRFHGGAASLRGAPVLLCIVFAIVLFAQTALGVWPPWAKRDESEPVYPDVTATVEQVRAKSGAHNVVLVDARPIGAYARGHVPGAVSMPPEERLPGDLAAAFGASGFSGDARYICYGGGSYSDAAAFVFWMLESGGAERVQLMEGGYEAWVASGGRADVEPRTLAPTTWRPEAAPELSAPLGYVREHYGVGGYEIIDARERGEWEGPVADPGRGPVGRVGHIPHSLQFDFDEFFEDGALLSAEESREVFSMLGPRPSSPVRLADEFIVHGDGSRGSGAMGYYLLRRAGIEKVRFYPGGWRRWIADESLPIVRFIGGEELKLLVTRANRWPWQDAAPSSFVLIDVRHEGDHARAHLPGSVCLTSRLFADSLDVYLERHWPDIDRASTPIVTYCYGPKCIRSRYTSTDAARAGFVNIWRFYGGLEVWRQIDGRIVE